MRPQRHLSAYQLEYGRRTVSGSCGTWGHEGHSHVFADFEDRAQRLTQWVSLRQCVLEPPPSL